MREVPYLSDDSILAHGREFGDSWPAGGVRWLFSISGLSTSLLLMWSFPSPRCKFIFKNMWYCVIPKGGTTNLNFGGSMHWKVGINTVKTLKYENGGGAWVPQLLWWCRPWLYAPLVYIPPLPTVIAYFSIALDRLLMREKQTLTWLTSARISKRVEGRIGIEKGYFFNIYPSLKRGITRVDLF